METRAYVRNVGIGPRKVRLVLDTIRGKNVKEAAAILKFTRTGSAAPLAKLLKSAVANAVNNHDADENDLFVKECYADDGQVLKRWMPRAKGNAAQILKRSSQVTIVVSDGKAPAEEAKTEVKEAKKKPAKKAEKAAEAKEAEPAKKPAKKAAKKTEKKEPAEKPVKKAAKKPAKKDKE